MVTRWSTLLAWLIPVPALLFGQGTGSNDSPFIVEFWTTDNNLEIPQNTVSSIIQSQDGYLWIGTFGGLARFDGVRFEVFDVTTRGLASSQITKLFEDSGRNLWIGTDNAGVLRAPPDGEIEPVNFGLSAPKVKSICEDSTGAVWLYTADGHLCRYHAGTTNRWDFGVAGPSLCRVVMAENDGRLWVGMDVGLLDLGVAPTTRPKAERLYPEPLNFLLASRGGGFWRLANGRIQKWKSGKLERDYGEYPWERAVVSSACEDQAGNLIVGTVELPGATPARPGVYWFDDAGNATHISTNTGLRSDLVLSVCMDRDGSLWVGTDSGGLNRIRRKLFVPSPEVANHAVQSIAEWQGGGLWVGWNGGLTYVRGDFVREWDQSDGLLNVFVRSVYVDRNQQVWVGTRGGPLQGLYQLRIDESENYRFEPVTDDPALRQGVMAIHQDRTGAIWFGTEAGLVRLDGGRWTSYTVENGLSANAVSAIADDADGNLWVGTEGRGLNRLHDDQIQIIRQSAIGLPGNDISALCVDRENALWVGTKGSGLARLKQGQWRRFSKSDGLAANSVNYLIEDGEGALWAGSYQGLTRVQKRVSDDGGFGFRVFGAMDGLPRSECTAGSQPAACLLADGAMLFPTIGGMARLSPESLTAETPPPPVVIESVLVSGKPVNTNHSLRVKAPSRVVLQPNDEQLEIRYTSLNLSTPEKSRHYRYQLEGLESAPFDAGNITLAHYGKLPPDEYRFVVTAANEDGVWNPAGASLEVIVLPPFWREAWFLVGTTILLLGAVVGTVYLATTQKVRREIRQQQALEKDRSRIARDLHDELGANMTQLSLLAEMVEADKDDPEEVHEHARQMTHTARQTTHVLDEIVWAVNPANDTLEGLVNYICKNAQDYLSVAGMKYRFDVPAQLPAVSLLPEVRHNVFLSVKEAVTNVVRHAGATSAWIRMRFEARQFVIEIADDGKGVPEDATQSTRIGLRNMGKRMEDIGGHLAIGRAPEGGALISLTVPMRT